MLPLSNVEHWMIFRAADGHRSHPVYWYGWWSVWIKGLWCCNHTVWSNLRKTSLCVNTRNVESTLKFIWMTAAMPDFLKIICNWIYSLNHKWNTFLSFVLKVIHNQTKLRRCFCQMSGVSFSFWLTPVGIDALFVVSHTLELNIGRRWGKKRRFFSSKKILLFSKKRFSSFRETAQLQRMLYHLLSSPHHPEPNTPQPAPAGVFVPPSGCRVSQLPVEMDRHMDKFKL